MEKVGERTIYSGRKISLQLLEFLRDGKRIVVEKVHHPGAVVVVPVLGDRIVYIEQYRPVIGRWIVELPAGTLDRPGESAEDAARRELEEETGYRAGRLEYLGFLYSSPGVMDEVLYVYAAFGLEKTSPRREDYEVIRVRSAPLRELVEAVKRGDINDAKTVAALFLYSLRFES